MCHSALWMIRSSIQFARWWLPGQAYTPVLERVRTRTRTQWVSPSPSPDSSPDSDSTLVDSDSDSDSTSVDSDSSAVDSDSGLMDSDSDSDSTQVDSDSQWVQVSPVRNVHGKFKLSCAIMDEIRGRYWLKLKWSRHWALPLVVKGVPMDPNLDLASLSWHKYVWNWLKMYKSCT